MNDKKTLITIAIIIVALGIAFAAITRTLYINGNLKAYANPAQFVVFDTTGDGITQTGITTVSGTGTGFQQFTFTTDTLENIGDSASAQFKIWNKSDYPITVDSIDCTLSGSTSILKLTTTLNAVGTTVNGGAESLLNTLLIELTGTYTGNSATTEYTGGAEVGGTVTCTVSASFASGTLGA